MGITDKWSQWSVLTLIIGVISLSASEDFCVVGPSIKPLHVQLGIGNKIVNRNRNVKA